MNHFFVTLDSYYFHLNDVTKAENICDISSKTINKTERIGERMRIPI